MGSGFAFNPLSIPHIVFGLSVVAVAVMVVTTRGNPIMRVGLLLVCLSALPYGVSNTILMSTSDPDVANAASRAFVGAVALLGPSLMMLHLAMAGRFERYRWLVLFAFCLAAVCALMTWLTDWVIEPEPWVTPLGFYFHEAKPLDPFVVAQFVVWTLVGLWLSKRETATLASERQSRLRSWVGAMLVLAVIGASDALLANKIGFYPFGVIPGTAAIWLVIFAIKKHDFLHARGFDHAGAIEAGIVVAVGAGLAALLWGLDRIGADQSPWLIAGVVTPVLLVAQAAMLLVRRRYSRSDEAEPVNTELESYIDLSGRVTHEDELREPLGALLARHAGLPDARLLIAGREDGVQVDARLRPWLVANPEPVVVDDLPTMRLGGLRQPVEEFMERLGAAVAMPLVDRESLVGFIVGTPVGARALRERETSVLEQAAAATAKTVTYASLLREASERIEVAKEVEVASAVQQARAAGEHRMELGAWELTGYYQPATQFGGHWWATHELPDGRFMVVVGDVTGSGVSAALVSFTAEGACETARQMFGPGIEVISLLETLDASVRHVGGAHHAMSCFAAIFDPAKRTVTYAGAGHPFPYVCRTNGRGVELRSLVSRGTPLGSDRLVLSANTFELATDDMVVFYSDSLVSGRSPEGIEYGERRFQRLLRNKVARAPSRATRVILDEVTAHWGGGELVDDVNLVVVRVGG